MEMRNHGSEFHVVQQSRRDKLRNNQNSSTSSQNLGYYRANLDHLSSLHQGLNVDLVQLPGWRYGNISCDSSSVLSSEMLNNFASNSHSNKLVQTGDGFAQPVKVSSSEPQNCCAWKTVESQRIGSVWNGIDGNMNPMFVGGETTLSGSLRLNNDVVPVSGIDVKTSYFGYHEKLCGDMQVRSSSHYHNTLQEVVTSASIGTRELDMTSMALQNTRETERNSWLASEDETRLIPTYVDQSSQLSVNHSTSSNLVNTQALSLSLSSVSPPKSYSDQIGERINNMPDLKPLKAFTHRDLVPLGPFTGYATILKSSGFLKPAQQLLDEFCNLTGGDKAINLSEVSGNNIMDEVGISGEAVNATPCTAVDSGASSSTFYSSNEKSHKFRGVSSSNESYPRPEYLQNKVKLLYMQDEVCRRYRQYHQQMQMVVSSFESVAGLSAATPYISLALKAVARQFRGFKNAISDQLRNIRKALGEDTGASSKRDASLKFTDQNLQNQNGSGEKLQYLEAHQTHVWRPQRGLPERAVAVLRAWLFDHFLHPYPTDTDKHMLASQTGLTRNQVSNWFINARVRVWKPMVEEIHMLETKAMVEKGGGSNVGKADGELMGTQPNERLNESQFLNVPNLMAAEECPPGIMMREKSYHQADMWNQDKRSRIECGHQLPVGFMPYQRNSLEIHGGLGAVSLTLGLRQSIEGPQQQQQQHENQLRQQFGGHIIRDFAG